jgi:hypothetical protein
MLTLSLGLVAFLLVTLVRNVTGEEYLYKLEGSDPSDYWPVHEYVTPEGQAEYVTPDFLANPSSPNRVVEYYAVSLHHVYQRLSQVHRADNEFKIDILLL